MRKTTFFSIVEGYIRVPANVKRLLLASLLLQMLNTAISVILNIYMRSRNYSDAAIADYTSYRFVVILFFSLPLGIYIKSRRLKPFFVSGAMLAPTAVLLLLYAVEIKSDSLIKLAFAASSLAFMLIQVCGLPFILRHCDKNTLAPAIALNFMIWSLASILTGIMVNFLTWIERIFQLGMDEWSMMLIITALVFPAPLLVSRLQENIPEPAQVDGAAKQKRPRFINYNWLLILKGMVPSLIIGVGAGLTIPFMNLFFNKVFSLSAADFALLNSGTAIVVLTATFFTPLLRQKLGFGRAIAVTQFSAIVMLTLLAGTELFDYGGWAFFIAAACYIARQPLMNMAQPLSSELIVSYVGPKNSELISAMQSTLWNASWFFSAKIFQTLRAWQWPYYRIFFITACLYVNGTIAYMLLARALGSRQKEEIEKN